MSLHAVDPRPDSSLKQEVFHQLTERWTGNTTVPNPTDSVSRSTSHHMTDRVQSNKSEPRKQDLSQKTKPSPRFNSLSQDSEHLRSGPTSSELKTVRSESRTKIQDLQVPSPVQLSQCNIDSLRPSVFVLLSFSWKSFFPLK